MSELLANLTATIKAGRRKEAVETTKAALDANASPSEVLNALVTGMDDVGRRFKANEIFVPEVLIAARAMKESMAQWRYRIGISPRLYRKINICPLPN